MLILCIILALSFDFLNGFNDSAALVATVVSSRALSPRVALRLAALGEFLGPFLFGVAVAKTIGSDLLTSQGLTLTVILASLLSAIIWNLVTWYFGIPSSSSHALVGGLIGSAVLASGISVVKWAGITKIAVALMISPPLGLLAGYLLTKLVYLLSRRATPRVNSLFRGLQVFTSFGLALTHGANDAQKTMGVITLVLLLEGIIPTFRVPLWVIMASATSIALGTSIGGWRQIKTLGGRIFRVRPVHGVASQLGSAVVIAGAALLGGPVSTTQVVSSSVLGAGAAERLSKVRWHVGQEMLTAWLLTIPATMGISALFYVLINWIVA
ncbi:MAG: inorganic phosphate transporter [Chloroflexi bacterium]|nr:inorganic phosphate transporter [Chloroflexota bacterium]